ncbi:TIGR02444 family protein [Alteromonas ponticola]|uniref:TIGR02444 family protein n=1 Tax=Alteromonas aquimaris TaxID=2998417 RepID=A0ABT3P8D0_9ALTE|nr:TIGR02444 family protein [Alteromonas aquimaris]MCW8109030.1 TIGR02444 family protein [Alteromonas aquimaris]
MTKLSFQHFWNFSVTHYLAGENKRCCLTLQDQYGVNVNLLLLLGWCITHHKIVTLVQWNELQGAIEQSDENLKAHRHRRQKEKQKTQFDSARYQLLKDQELVLERRQQADMLEQFSQQVHLCIEPDQVNGSIPAFVHSYNLRGKPDALALMAEVINSL